MKDLLQYKGKVVVVTGGSGGIGRTVCEHMAGLGASVVIADNACQEMDDVKAFFKERNLPMNYLCLDVSDQKSVQEGAREVQEKYGGADVLVTCAGISKMSAALDYTAEEWHKVQAINLDGTFFCACEFAKQMIPKEKGSMVLIGSIAGIKAVRPETHASYGTSKAATIHLAKLLANEWTQYGIRVNCISPGYVETELLDNVGNSDNVEQWKSQSPMHRLMQPAEIANAVVFMASDMASGITGANLMVDGGYTVW